MGNNEGGCFDSKLVPYLINDRISAFASSPLLALFLLSFIRFSERSDNKMKVKKWNEESLVRIIIKSSDQLLKKTGFFMSFLTWQKGNVKSRKQYWLSHKDFGPKKYLGYLIERAQKIGTISKMKV